MIEGLVTVVLPIYNVEKYLNRSILSVVNQTYKNLEILLIDDGSPDNCPKICEEWAQKDERIRVIHKENAGLGMARNTGIENATGEYICFFDSDDYIALDLVEKAYNLAKNESSDIVIFGFDTVDAEGKTVSSFAPNARKKTYSGDEVLRDFFPDFLAPDPNKTGPRAFYMSAWILLYSTKVIKSSGWTFVSEREIIAEDVYSLLSLFKHIKKVAVLPEALYRYCLNETSLSRRYNPGRYDKIKYFYTEGLKLCEELQYDDVIVHRLSKPYIAFTIAAMKQEFMAPRPLRATLKSIKGIINDDMLQKALHRNKKDKVSLTRRVLFFSIRNRLYPLCYLLLKLRA